MHVHGHIIQMSVGSDNCVLLLSNITQYRTAPLVLSVQYAATMRQADQEADHTCEHYCIAPQNIQ
jgi:hypothetical protein